MSPDPPCHRFETEALELLERGEALPDHFATCEACLEAQEIYERLKDALAKTGEEAEPPSGWQDRVRERVAQQNQHAQSRRWRNWGLGLAAAAVLAWAVFRPLAPIDPSVPIGPISLEITLEKGETVVRGTSAQPGDTLTLKAQLGGRPHAELRLYREEEELILRCSTESPCERRGDVLQATVPLPAVGLYQTLLLASDQPLPASSESFDVDAGAALRAGAELVVAEEIEVR